MYFAYLYLFMGNKLSGHNNAMPVVLHTSKWQADNILNHMHIFGHCSNSKYDHDDAVKSIPRQRLQ